MAAKKLPPWMMQEEMDEAREYWHANPHPITRKDTPTDGS